MKNNKQLIEKIPHTINSTLWQQYSRIVEWRGAALNHCGIQIAEWFSMATIVATIAAKMDFSAG